MTARRKLTRHGLVNLQGDRFWTTPDDRYFAYKHRGCWLVYLRDGNGPTDDDCLGGAATLRDVAAMIRRDVDRREGQALIAARREAANPTDNLWR